MYQPRLGPMSWLAGPAAGILFAASLLGFAAMRTDGYSHATKAVSELGAVGAPSATAFNILAFIVPGMLLVLFSLKLRSISRDKTGPYLLIASGASLALAGLAPAELDNYRATTTIWHLAGAMGSGAFWVGALLWLGPLLRDRFRQPAWGRITPWFGLFMLANIGWQIAFRATGLVLPGWGQRIGFSGYFIWFAVTGLLLWRERAEIPRP
ncbi:MAG: hypothetical protein JWO25_2638 [Alphaproteobacteria bacterium]|nr:hypothetical protein [Alphaproteobacteria bacterium]